MSTRGIWCTILSVRIFSGSESVWHKTGTQTHLPNWCLRSHLSSTPVGTGSQCVTHCLHDQHISAIVHIPVLHFCPGHKLKLYLRHLIHVNLQRGCCHDTANSSMMSINVSWIMLALPKPTLTCDLVQ